MHESRLKLLIVDDEPEIRAGIGQIIPWEANGVTVAGMAGNGKEALGLIRSIRPDIVLLDIRMPLLNGLEVLERIAGEPGCPQVIILSGYDDFQYCRRALRTGVVDYLLKPCRPEEVLNAVLKVKAKIRSGVGREAPGEDELQAKENAADPDLVYREQLAIVQCVRTNDSRRLFPAVEAFFAQLMRQGSIAYAQKMVLALICSIYQVCMERGVRTERIFGPNLSILDELPYLQTPEELQQRICQCVRRIVEERPARANQWIVVNNALRYMESHYAEALSLEKVARAVYVSAGYLSAIFKKVTRKNFVDCLHDTRVAQARELLRDGRLKVYEVALRVGYKDEKYFSQIFKKVTGMTPNQYRETTR